MQTFKADEVKQYKEEDLNSVHTSLNDKTKDLRKQILSGNGFVNAGLEVETNARLSKFEQEKVYDNMWTNSSLNLLESWLKKSRGRSTAHVAAAKGARYKHRLLTIPTLFVGATASALAFFSAGDTCNPDDDGSNALKYSTAVLTSILAIMGGIGTLYSFSEKMSQNIMAAGAFDGLASRIETQIFLPNALRSQVEVCLVDFSSQLEHLIESSPLI